MRTPLLSCLAPLALALPLFAQGPSYSSGNTSAGIGSVTGGTYVPMVYIDCLTVIGAPRPARTDHAVGIRVIAWLGSSDAAGRGSGCRSRARVRARRASRGGCAWRGS